MGMLDKYLKRRLRIGGDEEPKDMVDDEGMNLKDF